MRHRPLPHEVYGKPRLNQLTSQAPRAHCETPGHIIVIIRKANRRFAIVPDVAFREETASQLSGWRGRQPGGSTPANQPQSVQSRASLVLSFIKPRPQLKTNR